jgi:hypothetical protein
MRDGDGVPGGSGLGEFPLPEFRLAESANLRTQRKDTRQKGEAKQEGEGSFHLQGLFNKMQK